MSRAGQMMTYSQFEYAARQIVKARNDKGVRFIETHVPLDDGWEVVLRVDGKVKRAFVGAMALWSVDSTVSALDRAIGNAVRDARMVVHVDRDTGDEHVERAA